MLPLHVAYRAHPHPLSVLTSSSEFAVCVPGTRALFSCRHSAQPTPAQCHSRAQHSATGTMWSTGRILPSCRTLRMTCSCVMLQQGTAWSIWYCPPRRQQASPQAGRSTEELPAVQLADDTSVVQIGKGVAAAIMDSIDPRIGMIGVLLTVAAFNSAFAMSNGLLMFCFFWGVGRIFHVSSASAAPNQCAAEAVHVTPGCCVQLAAAATSCCRADAAMTGTPLGPLIRSLFSWMPRAGGRKQARCTLLPTVLRWDATDGACLWFSSHRPVCSRLGGLQPLPLQQVH